MAGLYGAERLPHLELVRHGLPIPAEAEGWLNLIHVHDAAAAVLAAEAFACRHPGVLPRVWLISDGHPCRRREFYEAMAEALGAPAPRFVPPMPGSGAAGRAMGHKRICNRRMIEELGVRLEYPSYRAGLARL
jgi:nucleoside-diphosphate-sugar epimerase